MKEIKCVHQGSEFRFIVRQFFLHGQEVTAEQAAQDTSIIAELVSIGAGVLEKIQVAEIPYEEKLQQILQHPIQKVINPQTLPPELLKQSVIDSTIAAAKSDLVTAAWKEYNATKLERKKMSTSIHKAVDDKAAQDVLTELYQSILVLQEQERRLYNRAQYIEKNGTLPEEQPAASIETIEALKLEKRRLIDLRSKLTKKLTDGKAKNPSEQKAHKLIEWQLELDQAEAAYTVVEERINKMRGK